MKKVLIAQPIRELIGKEQQGFLQRADIRLTSVATNDEIAAACRIDRPDLIISKLDLPGRDSVDLFETLRDSGTLRDTAVIMIHEGRPGESELAQQCSADAVYRMPINVPQLLKQAHYLLDMPLRESYRVLLSVKVESRKNEGAFFCRSENISATGLLLETERTLVVGDRIECSFFLPGSSQVVVHAKVVRQVPAAGSGANRYGIQFLDVPVQANTAIDLFLKKKLATGIH